MFVFAVRLTVGAVCLAIRFLALLLALAVVVAVVPR